MIGPHELGKILARLFRIVLYLFKGLFCDSETASFLIELFWQPYNCVILDTFLDSFGPFSGAVLAMKNKANLDYLFRIILNNVLSLYLDR